MPMQVLVVDDGGTVAETLRRNLPDRHYAVATVGRDWALREATDRRPDLIVLNGLSAPALTIELARQLQRKASGARIVAVVPSTDLPSDGGSITCLSRVPTEDELVRLGREGRSKQPRVLRVGKVSLNLETRQLDVDGEVSILTPKQFKLLRLFMSRPGQVFTRKQIMKEVWDTDYTGDTRTLDVHIHWVREKLRDVPGPPRYLQTVRRVGYRLVDPSGTPLVTGRLRKS